MGPRMSDASAVRVRLQPEVGPGSPAPGLANRWRGSRPDVVRAFHEWRSVSRRTRPRTGAGAGVTRLPGCRFARPFEKVYP
jgi:hypothetical protein